MPKKPPSPGKPAAEPAVVPDADVAATGFAVITKQLEDSIAREQLIARAAAAGAVFFGALALWFLLKLADAGLDKITKAAESSDPGVLPATTIYLLVRGTAYAAIVSGILYAVIGLARSALDQATRFDKRLIAARFIDYAMHAPHLDAQKMEVALRVLQAWGASVDSAYTPAKAAAKRTEIIKASAGKDGISGEFHSSNEG